MICSGKEVIDPSDQELYIELDQAYAYAAGMEAWVLSHEAFKSAFQLATAAESLPRMEYSGNQRKLLERVTNGLVAETRQLYFGVSFEQEWRKRLSQMFKARYQTELSELEYFHITEKIFSLPSGVFMQILNSLFDSETNVAQSTMVLFLEHGVFE